MVLQELAFPGDQDDLRLFFRTNDGQLNSEWSTRQNLRIQRGTWYSTDTFFNEFDLHKWRNFCDIPQLRLELTYSGKINWKVATKRYSEDSVLRHEMNLSSERIETAVVPVENDWTGRLYCHFSTDSDHGGNILGCRVSSERDSGISDLGIVICTYRREKEIQDSIESLRLGILENSSSRLFGKLRIIVADNGRTLKTQHDGPIRILHGLNTGGTGGFMRGMQQFTEDDKPPVYMLLMDDDVRFHRETIERAWSFLSSLKKGSQNTILAGAMIRSDYPTILHESIAGWTGVRLRNRKTGLDLAEPEGLSAYHGQISYKRPYAAWWFCAFSLAGRDRLPEMPPPLFIKGDDVYFSLGNGEQIISLNGVSVWHCPFDLKYAPEFNRYFALRNLMIVNTRFMKRPKVYNVLSVGLRVLAELAVYNYRSAELSLKASKDYRKGPDWLFACNQDEYLAALMNDKEDLHPVDRVFERRWDESRPIPYWRAFLKVIIRLITLSGHVIPSCFLRKETVITLGYTNLESVPVLSKSYYALRKDNKVYAFRPINQWRGLGIIWKLMVELLCYVFSGVDGSWKAFFKRWRNEGSQEYWAGLSGNQTDA